MDTQTTNVCLFLGGRSLGARTALRRNDSLEDLKETTITVNITSSSTIVNYNWLEMLL